MLTNCENTRKQGEIGFAFAIKRFVQLGCVVCIPLTDSQPYDLVVEKDGKFYKIQVKTTYFKSNGKHYSVNLRKTRCNSNGDVIRTLFDSKEYDFIYALTNDQDEYIIPCQDINASHTIHLGPNYDKYKVS